MLISVALSTSDLKSLEHKSLSFSSSAALSVIHFAGVPDLLSAVESASCKGGKALTSLAPGQLLTLKAQGATGIGITCPGFSSVKGEGWLLIKGPSQSSSIQARSLKRASASGKLGPSYHGNIVVFCRKGSLRAVLICDLDEYLRGVLASEIPASYHIEAIKTQAVAARTYGLNPRISHYDDVANVCDSYLCCQYFSGVRAKSSQSHLDAIARTAGEVLMYDGHPALALFSSCSGGHTESYENCFSDPKTGAFPPPPLPYLRGVAETLSQPQDYSPNGEKELRTLFASSSPNTVDAWSPHFKWSVNATSNDIESYLHANADKLLSDSSTSSFVRPPSSKKFGLVKSFKPVRRGVAGTIIELEVETSTGSWFFQKELTIRDLFKMPSAKVTRLKSARMFFDHAYAGGRLSRVSIRGLGWGHGVGMQQTGAQGWAKAGKDYRFILNHYFPGTTIKKV